MGRKEKSSLDVISAAWAISDIVFMLTATAEKRDACQLWISELMDRPLPFPQSPTDAPAIIPMPSVASSYLMVDPPQDAARPPQGRLARGVPRFSG